MLRRGGTWGLLFVAAAVLGLVGCRGGSEAGGTVPTDCGRHIVQGVRVMTHCGPATAEVVVGGRTLEFEGGVCQRGDGFIAVNVGTQVFGQGRGQVEQRFFGLVAGDVSELGGGNGSATPVGRAVPLTRDGIYEGNVLLTWVAGNSHGALAEGARITFAGQVTTGTFVGAGINGAEGKVSGSFDCGRSTPSST